MGAIYNVCIVYIWCGCGLCETNGTICDALSLFKVNDLDHTDTHTALTTITPIARGQIPLPRDCQPICGFRCKLILVYILLLY